MIATQSRPLSLSPDLSATKVSFQRWTHGLVNRIVMILDATCLMIATFIYWDLSGVNERLFTWLQAGAIAVITLIGFRIALGWMLSYRVERYSNMRWSLSDITVGILLSSIPAAIILLAFLPEAVNDRQWLIGWTGAIFIGLAAGRTLARMLVHIIKKRALLRRRVIVISNGPEGADVIKRLSQPALANEYQIVGVVDPGTSEFTRSQNVSVDSKSTSPDLTQYAQNYAVDLVIIAIPWDRSAEIIALTRRLQWIAADVVVPFELGGLNPQFAPRMVFADVPLLQLMRRPFKGSQGLLKMFEDYIVAVIALVVVWPFLLGAAIAIRLEGSGPILFRQPRVGFNSRPFMMYKFRTMTVDTSDDGSKGTQRNNHRITRVGAFLRRTSIDELPQLINVLRGEMSIVGPRPHVSNMLVGSGVYSEVVQQYAARHRIKPGITGWAQINGMRGGIDTLEKANRGAELDLFYVANWSPRFDLRIMVRTIVTGLVGRNVF
jgi:putative colanic acid biosynthesis UDP-glucose lipid carrier transferase